MKTEGEKFEAKIFNAGELILRQGDTGEQAYLVNKGKVRVFLQKNGRIIDLAELGPGQIVGEMSLLTGHKNAASVEALEEVSAGVITKEIIREKIDSSDPLVRKLIRMLVDRVRSTDSALLDSETREYIEIDLI